MNSGARWGDVEVLVACSNYLLSYLGPRLFRRARDALILVVIGTRGSIECN